MSWRLAFSTLLRSGTAISMASGLTGTGVYVSYADWTRFRRMMTNYATGNILPPMAENAYETVYFQRPKLEQVGLLQTTTNNSILIVVVVCPPFVFSVTLLGLHHTVGASKSSWTV